MNFLPTYLYIKRHCITNKLYFGKTIKKDPINYRGSGLHWINHIKKYGKEQVETPWYCLFTEKDECSKFALLFSEQQNIVKSNEWLNQIPEDGLTGGSANKGRKHSIEERLNQSLSQKGRHQKPHNPETKLKISTSSKGKSQSLKRREEQSKRFKDIKKGPQSIEHRKKLSKIWILQSPEGLKIIVNMLGDFCKINGLNISSIKNTIKTKKSIAFGPSKGWKIL